MVKIVEYFLQIMRKTAIPFMISSVFLNIIGYFAGKEIMSVSSFFQLYGTTYESTLQLFFLSLLIGIINTMFDTDSFLKKIVPLYKNMIRFIIVILLTTSFAWFYRWFAMDNMYAWISFIIVFTLCISISIMLSLYLSHKKNKEYEELLRKYKERGQHHEGHSN